MIMIEQGIRLESGAARGHVIFTSIIRLSAVFTLLVWISNIDN